MQSAYDPVAGTRRYTVTIRLQLLADNNQISVVDPYYSRDARGAGDPRWDHTLLGQPLRALLGATVIVNPNKGEIKGAVKDAQTLIPLAGAGLVAEAQDEGYLGYESTQKFGTADLNGNYVIEEAYAGLNRVECSAVGYENEVQQVRW